MIKRKLWARFVLWLARNEIDSMRAHYAAQIQEGAYLRTQENFKRVRRVTALARNMRNEKDLITYECFEAKREVGRLKALLEKIYDEVIENLKNGNIIVKDPRNLS